MKLEDSSQFTLWAKWSINLFVQARILADVPLAFPQYPLLGPATLTADKEWWDRQAKSNTIKALREEQIFRPLPRVELKWDATETTLDEKTFKAKEKAAAKEYHESKAHFEKIYDLEFAKMLAFLKMETRRTVYEKLKDSLGLHFISATNVAAYGDAVGLLNEVHQFTPTDNEARKAHLISSFWDSSFQKEGTNDLAVWINYVTTAVHDLEQVGEVVSEASKTSRLLTALPIEIFREFKISRGVKPNKWTETVASLRVYAMIPEIQLLCSSLNFLPLGRIDLKEVFLLPLAANERHVATSKRGTVQGLTASTYILAMVLSASPPANTATRRDTHPRSAGESSLSKSQHQARNQHLRLKMQMLCYKLCRRLSTTDKQKLTFKPF
jgi:hypothetical protein